MDRKKQIIVGLIILVLLIGIVVLIKSFNNKEGRI